MTFEKKIAKVFNLNDENWMKHANPWSVYTRYTVLPIIILAFWARIWIAPYHWIAVIVSIAWMFFNPVVFKKPKSTNNWASKCVLGERVYLNRKEIKIPNHHKLAPNILNAIAGIGMTIAIYGTVKLNVPAAVYGTLITYLGKSWFLDRMVWLYEDMKHVPEYKKWLY